MRSRFIAPVLALVLLGCADPPVEVAHTGDPPPVVDDVRVNAVAAADAAIAEGLVWIDGVAQAQAEAEWYEGVLAAQDARRAAAAAAAHKEAQSTPAAPPGASEAPRAGSCGGWHDLISSHFPAEQVGRACRVMLCESNGNPNAHNKRSSASGLFQFLDSTWGGRHGLVEARAGDAGAAGRRRCRTVALVRLAALGLPVTDEPLSFRGQPTPAETGRLVLLGFLGLVDVNTGWLVT